MIEIMRMQQSLSSVRYELARNGSFLQLLFMLFPWNQRKENANIRNTMDVVVLKSDRF